MYSSRTSTTRPLPPIVLIVWSCTWNDSTTDDNGSVQFTTIYPGWYSGRTVHIHVRIRTYSGTTVIGEFVDQIFFDDSLTDTVFTQAPYNTRASRNTRNANDMVVTGTNNGAVVYASMTQTAAGYSGVATCELWACTLSGNTSGNPAGGVFNYGVSGSATATFANQRGHLCRR